MRDKTISVTLGDDLYIKTSHAFQYDYGLMLVIDGVQLPAEYEVHFSNKKHGVAKKGEVTVNGVKVPDEYLRSGENVYAWVFLRNGDNDGYTVYSIEIPVIRRSVEQGDNITPVEHNIIDEAIKALEDAVEKTDKNVHNYPYINEDNNNWMVYDADQEEFVDTGVDASGSGTVIDDTAGTGETDKTWSANKLINELDLKAPKESPEFTGSISLGRKENTEVGDLSVAIGYENEASQECAVALGWDNAVSGWASFAAGCENIVPGEEAVAIGDGCTASGMISFATGSASVASGSFSHAEGNGTTANLSGSHAEGLHNVAMLKYPSWVSGTSYSVGDCVLNGALGYECIVANNKSTFDSTQWKRLPSDGPIAHVVGNGRYKSNSNAYALDWDGTGHFGGDVYVNCNSDSTGGTKLAKITDIPEVATVLETQAIISEYGVSA